jgi:hypothetical protein
MNMRALGILAILCCCALPTDIYSEPTQPVSAMGLMRCVQGVCDETEFQAQAFFNLAVQKSKVLKLGKSRLETKSAFATYTNEFFAGVTNALKIQFFTQPIMEEARTKLLRGDNQEISRGGYATLVLFLDDQNQMWQANLTYAIAGTTVARTVASSCDELTKYFFHYHFDFDHNRLQLKSKGSYTAPDLKEETLTLSWDMDLDLPVFDRIKN